VTLQHNSVRNGRQAHLAHAAVMGLHALCCGLPALALMAAAASGATSGVALLSDSAGKLHDFLHQHELWILVISAALVVIGGWLEVSARRKHRHGFPWLFAFSVLCFLANVSIILAHRAI
jgi:cytochrome bd-type quinol oxidase subunit 2